MAGLGDPVSGENFINRQYELDLLNRRLASFVNGSRRNIAIIGLRKIGKSSIIQEFIQRNKKEGQYIFIQVYLPEANKGRFIVKVIGSLIVNALKKKNEKIEPQLSMNKALNLFSKHYPRTGGFAYKMVYEKNAEINELLTLFRIFQKESELFLIIIFDEFQRIVGYGFRSPIDEFREFIMKHDKLWFIVAGSAVGMLNELINSSESPLFGHFEEIQIKEFNFESSAELIRTKLNPFSGSQEQLGFIYELTNGNPYYIDILTFRIKDIMQAETMQQLSDNTMINAIYFEMFSPSGAIYNHLSSLMEISFEKRGFGSYIEILKSIASGSQRASEIADKSGIELSSLPRYLKKLNELDIIRKREKIGKKVSQYYFVDEMLELWLNDVYVLRENPLISSLDTKKREFENRISQILSTYKSEIGKGNEARIRELLNLLDGTDKFHGLIIPKFDSVESFDNGKDEIDIVAKNNTCAWLGEIKDSDVKIGDIKKFLEKTERVFNQNQIKKIFIALSGIEQKCDDFCKKNNVLLLNRDEINTLLKKYKRKRILF